MSKSDGEDEATRCFIVRGAERTVKEAERFLDEIAEITQSGEAAFVAVWVDGEATDFLTVETVATWVETGVETGTETEADSGRKETSTRCRTAMCESGKARKGRSTGRSPQQREPS